MPSRSQLVKVTRTVRRSGPQPNLEKVAYALDTGGTLKRILKLFAQDKFRPLKTIHPWLAPWIHVRQMFGRWASARAATLTSMPLKRHEEAWQET